ncbi:MAG: hypothetical protein JSV92_04115 [archaeon]|nr:MAG: hypothetical protein JSV92_04115 [archaeon]
MELISREELLGLIQDFENFHYVAPDDFPNFSDKFPENVQEVAYKIGKSETGAILLVGEKTFLLIPPFPVEKTFEGDKNPLLEMLKRKYNLAIILLRLGEYSLGVFEGGKLAEHKTGTQFVGGKTKAGGQSAARYQRIREGQANDFFKKVCEQARSKLSTHELDFVFFGGDAQTAKAFLKKCDWLEKFHVMKRILNIRHMKLESLKASLKEVWKFRVYEI